MRALFFLLVLVVSHANAAPPCFPYDSVANAVNTTLRFNEDGGYVVWFCDGGHVWSRHWIGWTWTDAGNDANAKTFRDAVQKPHAEKTALWDQYFANQPAPIAGSADARLAAAAQLIPAPTDAPPSGFVTQTADAYKRSEGIGKFTMVKIGTVALGVACDNTNTVIAADGTRYTAIPRTSVTIPKAGNYTPPLPTTVYGRCQ